MLPFFWAISILLQFEFASLEKKTAPSLKDYSWLVGNWCGQTDNGQAFCEMWNKGEKNQMIYRVRLEKGSYPVDFVIKSRSKDSFICENLLNDFPKSIHYQRNGKELLIVLKGNEQDKEVIFNLKLQHEQGKN